MARGIPEALWHIQLIEYYLLNSEGDFLLVDSNNKHHLFVCKTEAIMASFEQQLYGFEKEDPTMKGLIAAIKSRKLIPCFYNDACYQTPMSSWSQYFHKAQAVNIPVAIHFLAFRLALFRPV